MPPLVKKPPAMQETWVGSLDWEDPLEKGKATHSQYSGLENSMECIVCGVTKSSTGLSDFHVLSLYTFIRHCHLLGKVSLFTYSTLSLLDSKEYFNI